MATTKHYALVLNADGFVLRTIPVDESQWIAWGVDPGVTKLDHYPVSVAIAKQVGRATQFEGSSAYQWHYDPGTDTLTQQTDDRPTATWGPVEQGETDVDVELVQGASSAAVTLTLSVPLNSTRLESFAGFDLSGLDFSNGAATIAIQSDVAGESIVQRSTNSYRLTNKLRVRVYRLNVLRLSLV